MVQSRLAAPRRLARLGLALLALAWQAPALAAETRRYTLQEALTAALARHPDLQVASDAVERQQSYLYDATAQRFLLSASAKGGDAYTAGNLLGPGGAATPSNLPSVVGEVDLTVPLFTGFKVSDQVRSAQEAASASVEALRQARSDLALEVARDFWGLRKAELVEDNQGRIVAAAEQTRAVAAAGLSAGRRTQDDVDQAEAGVLSAKADLAGFQGETAIARAQLAAVLGRVGEPVEAVGFPGLPAAPPALSPDIVDLAGRPDVRAAVLKAQAAKAAALAARGDFWPQVAFTTSYQHGNLAKDPTTGVPSLGTFAGTWQARLGASWNLFDSFDTPRTARRADLDWQDAMAVAEKVTRQASVDLAQAIAGTLSAYQKARTLEQAATLAKKHLDFVFERYRGGVALQLEVTDARTRYQTASTQRVQALIDYQVALAQLAHAQGRGVWSEAKERGSIQ